MDNYEDELAKQTIESIAQREEKPVIVLTAGVYDSLQARGMLNDDYIWVRQARMPPEDRYGAWHEYGCECPKCYYLTGGR